MHGEGRVEDAPATTSRRTSGGTGIATLADTLRPSQWKRVRFFTTRPGTTRSRRPTDAVLFVVAVVVVAVVLPGADDPPTAFAAALADTIGRVTGIWQFAVDALLAWAVLVLVLALARRHYRLARDMVGAAALGGFMAAALSRAVFGEWPAVLDSLVGTDPPVLPPALSLAVHVAVTSVASPHLTRPGRYLGRVIVTAAFVGMVALEVTTPDGAILGLAVGLAAAALVHLVAGSPGGLPSHQDVADGLAMLQIDAAPVGAVLASDGVAVVDAIDRAGSPLQVRVYGRDAWDGQLIAGVWRFLMYREDAPTFALSRMQQVEHEAMVTLLAERRGADVAPVVAVGHGMAGDALLVVRRTGVPLGDRMEDLSDGVLDDLWAALERLHAAGIVHGRIEPSTVLLDEHDTPSFSVLTHARSTTAPELRHRDRAQLLVTTAVAVGPGRAVAAIGRALPSEEVGAAASYVQPAALPLALRSAVDDRDLDLDALREEAAAAASVELTELPRLRRVTVGSVLMALLLLLAVTALVSSLMDVGIDAIIDALQSADGTIVAVAFFVGQLPRFANGFAVLGAAPIPLPYGRVAAMQFAITFVNLAMPATAARVAVNIRFFRRAGLDTVSATAVGVLDSVSGFIVQISLIATILLAGLGSIELNIDDHLADSDALVSLLLLVLLLLVLGIGLLIGVPRLRHWVLDHIRPALQPLHVLRSPARVLQLFGANLLAELLFGATIAVVLMAFDQDIAFADAVLINECVALFAGLMPVPGGIGVTEAALTAGFVAVGVPEDVAFAAALTQRVVTYYLPPVIGFGAMRWLQRNRYL